MALTACGQTAVDPAEVDAAFSQRAQQVAQEWHDSGAADSWSEGFRLLDRALRTPEDWPIPHYSDEPSFDLGSFQLEAALPDDPPPNTVDLEGEDVDVDVYSAEEAFELLTDNRALSSENCSTAQHGCDPQVRITAVESDTAQWYTNHGMRELPVWKYTVEGFDEPVVQVAFDVDEPPDPPRMSLPDMEMPEASAAALGLKSASGTELTFHLDAACKTDIRPLVEETEDLVLLGGSGLAESGECMLAGTELEEVTVELSTEVADRVILDAVGGRVPRFSTIYPG